MSNNNIELFDALLKDENLMVKIENLVNDERIPTFLADRFFTPTQRNALDEVIPMTQEIFDKCLNVCHQVSDGVSFHRIIKRFPDFEVNFDPSVQKKYQQEYEEYKSEYLKKWGDDAIYFVADDE